MSENKLTEYNKPNIFQRIAAKIQGFINKFRNEQPETSENNLDGELTIEELEDIRGGIPVDPEDLSKKTWILTPEQQEEANNREGISTDELSEEELEEIKAGQPLVQEGIEPGE